MRTKTSQSIDSAQSCVTTLALTRVQPDPPPPAILRNDLDVKIALYVGFGGQPVCHRTLYNRVKYLNYLILGTIYHIDEHFLFIESA